MPSAKCEGLSYPTHFLKSRGSVNWNIFFLNTELNKSHLFHDEMIFMHCTLQIKQSLYCKFGNFREDFIFVKLRISKVS